MPYRRNYRKKTYRRKRTTPSNAKGPLSVKLPSKFIYEDSFSLNVGAAGTAANYVFSANGLYDPNITGTGHQPRGFDQLMTLYDHYVVIASKITIWASLADVNNAGIISVRLLDGATTASNPNDILENRFVKTKILSPEGSGPNSSVITMKCNPNSFLGRSKPLSDPDLKGDVSNNPAEQAFFHVSAMPLGDGVDLSDIVCRARIEYTAVLIEPKQPSQS